MPDLQTVNLLRDGAAATIELNRPDALNAWNGQLGLDLLAAVREVADDDSVRVVVVTGAGDQAFVSGADISEFGAQRTSPEARAEYDRSGADIARSWLALDKPIIAMIRGYCIGGGLITALQADIRIASDDSQFGVPAARLGLGYGFGGVEMLAAVVGTSWAAEILFSARQLSADEALQIGLVNRVVPAAELHASVMDLAGAITRNAPLTIAAIKAALKELRRPPERRDFDRVAELVEACFRSDDYREGQRAFAEKRPPAFKGR